MMSSSLPVLECKSIPPGLGGSDPESATVSRERRRVALAARVTAEQVSQALVSRLTTIEYKLDQLLNQHGESLEGRVARLEVLAVCDPNVDEVLEEMFAKREVKSNKRNCIALCSSVPSQSGHKSRGARYQGDRGIQNYAEQ